MNSSDAIVNPVKGKNSPDPGFRAIIISDKNNLDELAALLNLKQDAASLLMTSKLYSGKGFSQTFSLSGPVIGAAYAVLLIETLIAWGVREIIFFGSCGAISKNVKIGDIIVPTCSVIDEGVSKHYNGQWVKASKGWPENYEGEDALAYPSDNLTEIIKKVLSENELNFKTGMIWTTDAVFRETREKVKYFQQRGVLGVEMETSALFTVGKYRNVETSAILVVSDELATHTWRPGFRAAQYKKSRKKITGSLSALCKSI
ncbi:MAG: nucleoside phosphorylase [Deltaproteobacteria bacterium]|nr:nucleoside phosphorylase [Deltaproteobacteria bacterium]